MFKDPHEIYISDNSNIRSEKERAAKQKAFIETNPQFSELIRLLNKNARRTPEEQAKINNMSSGDMRNPEPERRRRKEIDNIDSRKIDNSPDIQRELLFLDEMMTTVLPQAIFEKEEEIENLMPTMSQRMYTSLMKKPNQTHARRMVLDRELGNLYNMKRILKRQLNFYKNSPRIVQFNERRPGLQMLEGTDWDRKNPIDHYLGDENVSRDISSYLGGKKTKKSKRSKRIKRSKRQNTFKKNKRHSKK